MAMPRGALRIVLVREWIAEQRHQSMRYGGGSNAKACGRFGALNNPADNGRDVPRPEFARGPLRKRVRLAPTRVMFRPKSQGAKNVPSGEPLKSNAKRAEIAV